MERYRWLFQDHVFFERHQELSDKQVRLYLGWRQAVRSLADPLTRREVQQQIDAGRGGIGIEDAELIADVELLCEKGFILRERIGW